MEPAGRVPSDFGDHGDRVYLVPSNSYDCLTTMVVMFAGQHGELRALTKPSWRKEEGEGMVETGGVEK